MDFLKIYYGETCKIDQVKNPFEINPFGCVPLSF